MATQDAAAVRETLRTMERAERYNEWLYQRCRPHLGPCVLDVGAGTGTFAKRLLADRRTVVAVEPDPELAAVLRGRLGNAPGFTIVEGEARDATGTFDAAICLNVLEHISDDEATLVDLRERLPRGRLLLLVPAHPALFGDIDEALGHKRRYSSQGLSALLARCDFRVEELRFVNPAGAAGWIVSRFLVRRSRIPEGALRLYDTAVPLLKQLDRLRLPFGLSLWAVARPRLR